MSRRGYLMPMAILIMGILVVTGMGFLSAQSRNYRAAVQSSSGHQARSIAVAGIEDAHIKLLKDPEFPPPGDEGQYLFTYQEELRDVGGGPVVGHYAVTVDTTYAEGPYYVIVVTSRGEELSKGIHYTVRAEFDVAPFDREDPLESNPDPYGILNWYEEGLNM